MTTYRNITEVKKANKAVGHYWFSPDTIKHFASRVETPIMGGRYWVESTRNADDSDREYKLCAASDDGVVGYLHDDKRNILRFASRTEALDHLANYIWERESADYVSH